MTRPQSPPPPPPDRPLLAVVSLPPPVVGQSVAGQAFVDAASDAGWEVRVVDLARAHDASAVARARTVATVIVTASLATIRRPRPACCYLHLSHGWSGHLRDLAVIGMCRLRRVPVVGHVHGPAPAALLARSPILRAVQRLLLAGTDVICLSPGIADEVGRARLFLRTSVVRNGVDDRFSTTSPRRADVSVVAQVGLLQESKGTDRFLDLAEAMVDAHDVRFLLIGAVGPDCSDALARRVATALPPNVTHTGFLDRDDLVRTLSEVDVACLLSQSEGAPLSILEAAAAGCLVLATDVGGIPDTIAHHGIAGALVSTDDDPATLETALRSLLAWSEDDDRRSSATIPTASDAAHGALAVVAAARARRHHRTQS